MTYTGDQGDLVLLESHPGATSIPKAPPSELVFDLGGRDRQARRQTFDDYHQRLAVGLARREKPEHAVNLVRRPKRLRGDLRIYLAIGQNLLLDLPISIGLDATSDSVPRLVPTPHR
jgi:hypothetical protein